MKKIIFGCLLVSLAAAGQAQLADTKWKSMMNIPEPAETVLHFKKDSVFLLLAEDGQLIESMTYTTKNDTLLLTKAEGLSPCEVKSTGTYRFELKDDKLTIQPLADDCVERSAAFNPEAWIRENN